VARNVFNLEAGAPKLGAEKRQIKRSFMNGKLENKVAVVTGGIGAIGLGAAKCFVRQISQ
jgi:hypothetical protein